MPVSRICRRHSGWRSEVMNARLRPTPRTAPRMPTMLRPRRRYRVWVGSVRAFLRHPRSRPAWRRCRRADPDPRIATARGLSRMLASLSPSRQVLQHTLCKTTTDLDQGEHDHDAAPTLGSAVASPCSLEGPLVPATPDCGEGLRYASAGAMGGERRARARLPVALKQALSADCPSCRGLGCGICYGTGLG